MGVIFDAANHEIGQVTVFMGNHIYETILPFISLKSDAEQW
jgi:hypothetical protein